MIPKALEAALHPVFKLGVSLSASAGHRNEGLAGCQETCASVNINSTLSLSRLELSRVDLRVGAGAVYPPTPPASYEKPRGVSSIS